jgi:hypothetical protein
MKKLALLFAICFAFVFQVEAIDHPKIDRPKFVKSAYASFQKNEYNRERAAFARPFGWGVGTYRITENKSVPFVWFAWANTSAYFQVKLSIRIYGFDLYKIRQICDINNRPYEVISSADSVHIGLSNEWIFEEKGMLFCNPIRQKNGFTDFQCDNSAVLRYYLKILSGKVPQLQFEVKEDMK